MAVNGLNRSQAKWYIGCLLWRRRYCQPNIQKTEHDWILRFYNRRRMYICFKSATNRACVRMCERNSPGVNDIKMTSKVLKCSNSIIVVCEVLALIQNKLDVMNKEDLMHIYDTSFSTEDIEAAKNLLFDSISSKRNVAIRKITRKKDGKSKWDLSDVIAVLKESDSDCVPIFVAKDLQKLPPVTFDHINATRLLKDILVLQTEVHIIKNSYVTSDLMEELRKDLTNLKQTSVVNNFPIENINRKRERWIFGQLLFKQWTFGPTAFFRRNGWCSEQEYVQYK